MKEATGELNMVVVVVVMIGVLMAFFYTVVWPNIRTDLVRTTKCNDAVCASHQNGDGTVTCRYTDPKTGLVTNDIICPWKG